MYMGPPVTRVCVFWGEIDLNQKQDHATCPPGTHLPKSSVPLKVSRQEATLPSFPKATVLIGSVTIILYIHIT